jgi:hypothetical protein
MIDPGTAILLSSAIGGLGSAFGGGGEEQKQLAGDLHLINPYQQQLYNQMYSGLMGGGGDFGYGSNIKAGTSQLQNMMAQRGIKVGSGGAYSGAYGNMVGSALGQDAEARRAYAMQLLQSPLQVEAITGANLVPGSPSKFNMKASMKNVRGQYAPYTGQGNPGNWSDGGLDSFKR